jgi:hypothetical protein
MPDELDIVLEPDQELIENRYTAFESWPYKQIIYVQPYEQSWINFTESFYFAAEKIIDGVASGALRPDVEGVAGVFCFRHYLELALKGIIMSGRWLRTREQNAFREEVTKVRNIHDLSQLWQFVVEDAKPKIDQSDWGNYDIPYVEACIKEFDERDKRGFAFRYRDQGGERYAYNFKFFRLSMRHIRHVLFGVWTYLEEAYHQNAEWQAELRSIAGF